MSRAVLLDSGPLGLVTNPKKSPVVVAHFWAEARQQGQPTADDKTIDADVILAAQASTLQASDVVIATTNVGHLARFVPARLWQDIEAPAESSESDSEQPGHGSSR